MGSRWIENVVVKKNERSSESCTTVVSVSGRWLVLEMPKSKQDKKLFTPGPLLVSRATKEAMLRDLGSRDSEFIEAVKFIRSELINIADVPQTEWTAVPMQGGNSIGPFFARVLA